jgi:hypothetical protein
MDMPNGLIANSAAKHFPSNRDGLLGSDRRAQTPGRPIPKGRGGPPDRHQCKVAVGTVWAGDKGDVRYQIVSIDILGRRLRARHATTGR